MPEHLLHGVADTRYLSGEFVKDGKPAFAKYCSDDVADIFKVISQQGNHGDHCAQTCNGRSEHAKHRHKAAAQFSRNCANAASQIQAIFSEHGSYACTEDVSNGCCCCARRVCCCNHGIHRIGRYVCHIIDVARRTEDFPSYGLHRFLLSARQRI